MYKVKLPFYCTVLSFGKCTYSFTHHHSEVIEPPSPTRISLCPFVVCASPQLQSLETNGLFYVPIVVSLPDCHINIIIPCVAFWFCLLSLNVIHLKFICIFTWLSSSLWSDYWPVLFWIFYTYWGLFWSFLCPHFSSMVSYILERNSLFFGAMFCIQLLEKLINSVVQIFYILTS